MNGELEYNKRTGCYEGETEDGAHWVSIAASAMIEARHIAAMRGESKTTYWQRLYQADTWVQDAELCEMDGIEIEPAS